MFAVKKEIEATALQHFSYWIAAHNSYVRTDSALYNCRSNLAVQKDRAETNMALYQGCQRSYDLLAGKQKSRGFWKFMEGAGFGAAIAIIMYSVAK